MSSGGKVNSNFDMDMGPVDVDMEGELKYLKYHYSDLVNFCFRQILKIHKENKKMKKSSNFLLF